MVLRLEHGSVLKKSHLSMDVARCYKRDGLDGIGPPVDVRTLYGTNTEKRY